MKMDFFSEEVDKMNIDCTESAALGLVVDYSLITYYRSYYERFRGRNFEDGYDQWILGGEEDRKELNQMTEHPERVRPLKFHCYSCEATFRSPQEVNDHHFDAHSSSRECTLSQPQDVPGVQVSERVEAEMAEWYDALFWSDKEFRKRLRELKPTDRWIEVCKVYEQRHYNANGN